MSNIIFTRPNYRSHLITPPLALGYLSSYMERCGHESGVIDGLNLAYSSGTIAERCGGADIVGISCMSDYFTETIDLSRRLKAKGIRVMVGGPQATALPYLTLRETGADYVIVGEGELTVSELLNDLDAGHGCVPGVLYKGRDAFRKRELINDLDSLPFPDWDKMDPNNYRRAPHGGIVKAFPVAPVISTRGCVYTCSFCASPKLWEHRLRFRSPGNVVSEIEYLVKRYGVREIHFEDDNLTFDRSHIEGICELLIAKKLNVFWAAPNGIRIDTVDRPLLELMKKSGCYFLAFGIESADSGILNNIGKGIDPDVVQRVIKTADELGIITQGFFIFGLPGETRKTVLKTIDFALKLPLLKAQFLLLDILPGSELYDKLPKNPLSSQRSRSFQQVKWVPGSIDREYLEKAPAVAFRRFFLRPRQFFNVIKMIKFGQTGHIIRRIRDFGVFNRF